MRSSAALKPFEFCRPICVGAEVLQSAAAATREVPAGRVATPLAGFEQPHDPAFMPTAAAPAEHRTGRGRPQR